MDSRIKFQFSYNDKNIKKNLFFKPHPNTETKRFSSPDKKQPDLLIPKKLTSCIYCRKIPKMEDKKVQTFIHKQKKIAIDSLSEIRLPQGFIDLSYDHHKNE